MSLSLRLRANPFIQRLRSDSLLQSLRSFAIFLGLTLLFAAAYCQSPLYTSNQNQYFLHGLARAGLGDLEGDWLANTLDPTPVFSALVELGYRLTHLQALFYACYALLMGIYLYSFLGIARELVLQPHNTGQPPAEAPQASPQAPAASRQRVSGWPLSSLLFLSLFIVIHSAGLRFGLSRLLGPNWTYVLEDGVADQRMLGTVLQPSAFGVFLALSVYLFLIRRPYWAVLSAVLAAAIHPTYLLGAALLTCAYSGVTWLEERRPARALRLAALALVTVAPVVVYTFLAFTGGSPEEVSQARHLLVHFRIPHHALASWWFDATAVFKILLVLAALYLARRSRLFYVLLVPFVGAVLLAAAQLLLGSDSLALLFPWRISVLLVPLSTTVILANLARSLPQLPVLRTPSRLAVLRAAALLAITLAVLAGGVRFVLDLERKASAPERAVESYVAAHRRPGQEYLIPVKMQDFRLEAGAAAYIEFKSIPYRAADVLEWHRRLQLADDFYLNPSCQALQALAAETITHLVMPAGQPLGCAFLQPVYADQHYRVYRLSKP